MQSTPRLHQARRQIGLVGESAGGLLRSSALDHPLLARLLEGKFSMLALCCPTALPAWLGNADGARGGTSLGWCTCRQATSFNSSSSTAGEC